MKILLQSLRILFVLTLLTGALYPLSVWAVGQLFFKENAEGSLLVRDGKIVGSALLAQKIESPRYFHARPSAGDFATVASGASNQAWTSAKLASATAERRAKLGETAPTSLLTTSGSGLDPHVSIDAITFQAKRVTESRHLTPDQQYTLDELIAKHVEWPQFSGGYINVLTLNLALDRAFPSP